jgi:oxygen-dependent protoporphyrinogen oxidase
MPRYTVGHLDRVAAAEGALVGRPEIILAGSAFHGVGIPDCVARGRAAGRRAAALAGVDEHLISRSIPGAA